MKTAASISPGRGRGIAPFPGPHPQKQNLAVYTKVLTHPRDRQKVRENDLYSRLVHLGRCYGLYPHFSNMGFTSPKVRL
jgi:hypothetical protein